MALVRGSGIRSVVNLRAMPRPPLRPQSSVQVHMMLLGILPCASGEWIKPYGSLIVAPQPGVIGNRALKYLYKENKMLETNL